MTREEAKKILEAYIACESKKVHFECSDDNCDDNCPLLYDMGTVGEYNEAINIAIQALEQEPTVTSTNNSGEMTYPQVESITPIVVNEDIYECSCGFGWDKNKTSRFHFCPNCGKAVGDGNDYKYIKSISKPTGIEFDIDIPKKVESYKKLLKHPVTKHIMDMDEEQEQLDFVQPHKKIPVTLTVKSGDVVSRQAAIDANCYNCSIKANGGKCSKCDAVKAIEKLPPVISQELNRDIEEITEVIKCDADAETKCKMISNILTAKPQYFEKQEPINEIIQKAYEDGKKDGYVQAKVEQEPKIGHCVENYEDIN